MHTIVVQGKTYICHTAACGCVVGKHGKYVPSIINRCATMLQLTKDVIAGFKQSQYAGSMAQRSYLEHEHAAMLSVQDCF